MVRGSVRVVTLLAVLSTAPAVVAAEGSAEQAKEHFAKGKELYKSGSFAAAAVEWQQAYELAPGPELLFNIARAFEQAGKVEEAVRYYERYLVEMKDPPDRAMVEATVKRLSEKLPAEERKAAARDVEARAAEHFRKGRELYRVGSYPEALTELNAAFELVPSSTLIYNMAKTREKVGDFAGAVRDYRKYLEMEPKAADRADVEYLVRSLEARVQTALNELTLESNPVGAEVYLDGADKLAGQTPLTVKLVPGHHSLRVVRNGFETASREFTMPDDRPLTLTFDMRPLENVGWLTVDCDQDGAHIFLDGTILALTPYKDRRALTAGRHQLVIEREGFRRVNKTIDVQKGKESHLRVAMESTEGRSKAPLVLAPLLGGGLLVVAAVGAGISSIFAVRAAQTIGGTRNWRYSLVAFGAGEAVAAAMGVLGVVSAGVLVGLWVALGFIGGERSEVTYRAAPVENAPVGPQEPVAAEAAP